MTYLADLAEVFPRLDGRGKTSAMPARQAPPIPPDGGDSESGPRPPAAKPTDRRGLRRIRKSDPIHIIGV
ncbi:hypothetical protein HMPREF0043_02344 [Actinobaculum sp. oral taxon 183 str. F0552]|nr:hypothetical protein HMPREF0043_02344 [Actinobaculum sp. oral taxon 183 str. F0552]